MKYGDPHSESFATSRTHSRTKRATSSLNIYSCTFGTVHGREHIDFVSYFNSKSTGIFSGAKCSIEKLFYFL